MTFFFVSLGVGMYSILRSLGLEPGAEFKAGIEESEKIGTPLAYTATFQIPIRCVELFKSRASTWLQETSLHGPRGNTQSQIEQHGMSAKGCSDDTCFRDCYTEGDLIACIRELNKLALQAPSLSVETRTRM